MNASFFKFMIPSAVLLAGFLMGSAKADTLLSDSFNYADGDLLTVSGGLWTLNSGSTALNVLSGQAIVTSANSQDDAQAFAAASSGTLYYGFDATVTSVPGTTGSYIATLWDGETGSATDYVARLQVAQGSTTSKVKFGILNDTGNAVVFYGSEFDLSTAVRIVVAFDFSTMTSTLWINPTDASSTSITDTVAASFSNPSNTLGNFLLRQASGIGTTAVDNLTVATTFAEVAAVPEPATVALIALGLGAAVWGVRRKRIAA
jgi:hypothetical protein